jgi:hypothetical protein
MNMQSNEGALRRMACLLAFVRVQDGGDKHWAHIRTGKIYLRPDHFLIFLMALFLSFFLSFFLSLL